MDSREKALQELKKRIREQKARVDPRLLKLAEQAALSRARPESASVPYDREAAEKAIAFFLETHEDRKGFEHRLVEFIMKNRN